MLTILELIRSIQTVNIHKSEKWTSENINLKTCGQMSKSEFGRKDRSNDDEGPVGRLWPSDYDDDDDVQWYDGDDAPNN